MRSDCSGAHSNYHGYSIIEVLVALLVLALGVIGGAAMQLAALRTRHQSVLLSHAVQLASSLADKMRANAGQMQLPDAANPYLNQHYDAALDGAPTAPPQQCLGGALCDSAQLAQFDLYEVKQRLRGVLPGGRFVICRDANAWDAARHGASWTCSGDAHAPVAIKLGWRGKNPDGAPALEAGGGQAEAGVAVVVTLAGAPP